MYLVEWLFESGPLNYKLCANAAESVFWQGVARSNGASMIVVTPVGVC